MSSHAPLQIEIDSQTQVAYIQISNNAVHSTVEFNDEILVDLDSHAVAVGIELLDVRAEIPLTDLEVRFHIPERALSLINMLLPSIQTRILVTSAPDPATSARVASGTRAPESQKMMA